jgi:hypothetical protein
MRQNLCWKTPEVKLTYYPYVLVKDNCGRSACIHIGVFIGILPKK